MSKLQSVLEQTLVSDLSHSQLPSSTAAHLAVANSMSFTELLESVKRMSMTDEQKIPTHVRKMEEDLKETLSLARKSVVKILAPGTEAGVSPDINLISLSLGKLSHESLQGLIALCISDPALQEQLRTSLLQPELRSDALKKLAKSVASNLDNPNVLIEILNILAHDPSVSTDDRAFGLQLVGLTVGLVGGFRRLCVEFLEKADLKKRPSYVAVDNKRPEIPELIYSENTPHFLEATRAKFYLASGEGKEKRPIDHSVTEAIRADPQAEDRARRLIATIHVLRGKLESNEVAIKNAQLSGDKGRAAALMADNSEKRWLESMYEQALAKIIGDFEARSAA